MYIRSVCSGMIDLILPMSRHLVRLSYYTNCSSKCCPMLFHRYLSFIVLHRCHTQYVWERIRFLFHVTAYNHKHLGILLPILQQSGFNAVLKKVQTSVQEPKYFSYVHLQFVKTPAEV